MSTAQVLVVEDETLVAKALQSELRSLGYSVPAVASSGEEAIARACESQPDVVLMDIVLKGPVDGIETARELRDRLDVPIVYLTAYGDDETLARAQVTEPFGYLLKPYDEKVLHTTIETTLYKHRMERRLKEANQWLAATLRSIEEAVVATDGRQQIHLFNPVAQALTGWDPAEARGQDWIDVCTIVDDRGRNVLLTLGTQAILERRGLPLLDGGHVVSRSGVRTPVEGCVAPLYDDDLNFTGLVVVFRDVTQRKQIEQLQRQSEDHLRHSQKMEAVSRLAGGVARDFNGLLPTIAGTIARMRARMPEGDPNLLLAAEIETAVTRAAEVVRRLVACSGRATLRLDVINLNELAAEWLDGFQRVADPRLSITWRPGANPWRVKGDAEQITEMLRNLCLNAQEAMPQDGHLVVETANVSVRDEHLRREWQAQPGDFVRLRVRDTGHGMEPEVRARIYEPFFTTKEAGRAAGLGLALVHGIVQEHGGWVECFSNVGRGTTFDIFLPRYGFEDGPVPLSETPAADR